MRAWYSAWADSSLAVRLGLEVEDRPQAGQDVQAVQAQVVGGPAGGDGGGQVAVAGAVDLLDPGVQAGDGFVAFGGRELPPCRGRVGVVAAGVGGELGGQVGDLPVQGLEPGEDGGVVFERVADAGDQVGELGQPLAEGGEVAGLAGVELGELLVLAGELLERGGDRVVAGHGQLQG